MSKTQHVASWSSSVFCASTRTLPRISPAFVVASVFGLVWAFMWFAFLRDGLIYTAVESDGWQVVGESRRLIDGDPWKTFLLTDTSLLNSSQVINPGRDAPPKVYTHNPWMLPRIPHAMLYLLGVSDVLVAGFIASTVVLLFQGLVALVLVKRLGWPAVLFVVLVCTDFLSYLRWSLNAPISMSFFLFGFSLVSILPGSRGIGIVALSSFLLWQHVLPFSFFVTVTMTLFVLYLWWTGRLERSGSIRRLFAIGLGSALSIGMFLTQLLLYYGVDGLVNDLISTVHGRNTQGVVLTEFTFAELMALYTAAPRISGLPMNLYQLVRHQAAEAVTHYGFIACLLIVLSGIGLASMLALRKFTPNHPLARGHDRILRSSHIFFGLALSGAAAMLLTASVLRGQVYMLYVYGNEPMFSYVVAAAFAATIVLMTELASFALPTHRLVLRAGICALGLLIWIVPSIATYHRFPPMDGELLWRLGDARYQRRRFIVYEHQYPLYDLVWLRTGGPRTVVTDQLLPGAPRERDQSPEFLACVDHWNRGPPGNLSCAEVSRKLVEGGHEVAEAGDRYAIIRLDRNALIRKR